MSDAPFRSVRRVVLVAADGAALTIYKKPRSKRRTSRNLRGLERAQRDIVRAFLAGNVEYLRRQITADPSPTQGIGGSAAPAEDLGREDPGLAGNPYIGRMAALG